MIQYNSPNNQMDETSPTYHTTNWDNNNWFERPPVPVPVGVGHVGGGIPPVGYTPSGGWIPSHNWYTSHSGWNYNTLGPAGWTQIYSWSPWQGGWIPRYPTMW